MLAENYSEYSRLVKSQVRDADLILCTTPSAKPLFGHEILTRPNGRLKARLIIAVGSYKKHMIEIAPEIIAQAVKVHGHGRHVRKRAEEGGVVLVDNMKALWETGELVQAELEHNHVVEIGEILMLDDQFAHEEDEEAVEDDETGASKDSMDLSMSSLAQALKDTNDGSRSPSRRSSSLSSLSRRSSSFFTHRRSHGSESAAVRTENTDGAQMGRWLSKGNVIYKSVGLGIMDLCMGIEMIKLAKLKGIGSSMEDF
jgi:ornithine cyclodeaminase/alanine dehydrogenase-like protein (mu-crystallin family)